MTHVLLKKPCPSLLGDIPKQGVLLACACGIHRVVGNDGGHYHFVGGVGWTLLLRVAGEHGHASLMEFFHPSP